MTRVFAATSNQTVRLHIIIRYYRMYQWRAKARMRPCACAGWCESAYFAHAPSFSLDLFVVNLKHLVKIFPIRMVYIRRQETLGRCAVFFTRRWGTTFVTSCFLSCPPSPFWRRVYSERKYTFSTVIKSFQKWDNALLCKCIHLPKMDIGTRNTCTCYF